MVDRMFVYAGLIYHAFRLPVRQIVFYIGKESLRMESSLTMPSFEYRYDLVDLQQVSYKEFIDSSVPEEVLMAILCNFGGRQAEIVVEEIFTRLRTLQESDLALGRSIRQLTMLSMLRDLPTHSGKGRTYGIHNRHYTRLFLPAGRERGREAGREARRKARREAGERA